MAEQVGQSRPCCSVPKYTFRSPHAFSSTPIMICSNINQPRSQQWSLERMQHQLRWASSVRFRYNHRAEVWALCLPSYRDGSFRGGMSFLGGLNKKKKTTKNLSCSLLF